jgi:hypothetical protein
MQIGPYLPLFDFEVEHTFFTDARCANALKFVLTPKSAELLQRSGFLARESDTGVAVLADSVRFEALSMIARDTEEPFHLTWLAYAADPLFCNYTEGLVYPPEGLPVFDSDRAVAEKPTGRWRLQREAYVSAADACSLDDESVVQALSRQRVPPLFIVTLRLGETGTWASAVRATVAGASASGASASEATVPLGKPEAQAPADTPAAALQPDPKRYVLRFAARAAVWKYWLIGDWRDSQPQVVDPDGQAAFQQAQDATLPDGRAAVTIRSVAPIAIFRHSPFRFQLRGRAGSGERLLVKRLPVAGTTQLTREPRALGGSLVSEIYVHR